MNDPKLLVREIQASDIDHLVHYWLEADDAFLLGMGVDLTKIPNEEDLRKMLSQQLNQSYKDKKAYCIIWQMDGEPIGHSNLNPAFFGKEATMHLHLWKQDKRKAGMGTELVKLTLPYFFNNMQLQKLYCEPYALNPAPNRVIEKTGFDFVKEYVTTPGFINFEQPVKHWKMSLEKFQKLFNHVKIKAQSEGKA